MSAPVFYDAREIARCQREFFGIEIDFALRLEVAEKRGEELLEDVVACGMYLCAYRLAAAVDVHNLVEEALCQADDELAVEIFYARVRAAHGDVGPMRAQEACKRLYGSALSLVKLYAWVCPERKVVAAVDHVLRQRHDEVDVAFHQYALEVWRRIEDAHVCGRQVIIYVALLHKVSLVIDTDVDGATLTQEEAALIHEVKYAAARLNKRHGVLNTEKFKR